MEFKLTRAQSPMLLAPPMFSLNFTVAARIRGPLTRAGLQSALDRLRVRHPLTAVRAFAGSDGVARFTTEGVPPIPLRIVERAADSDWVREVEREIPQPTDYRAGPLLRCIWLRGAEWSDLLLVCDHVTADGFAAVYALRDLLSLLADERLNLPPLPPPALAGLLPKAALEQIAELVRSAPPPAPQQDFGMEQAAPQPLQVIPVALGEAETAALVARCRAEGVTVSAALCAAYLRPFAEREPGAPVRKVELPVDLRNRMARPAGEAYSVYMSLAVIDVDCSPGRGLWDIARAAAGALAAVTEEQLFFSPTVVLHVADFLPFDDPFGVHYDISISNLGRVNIPAQYGALRLESVFGPTFNASQPGHRILGVTTFGGRMRSTYTSRDPEAPALARRAGENLAAMLR
jgi:hypothetical protein